MTGPYVYLTLSALGAINTVNAFRPLTRSGPGAVLGYLLGWPTSELPLHVLVVQVVATAVAVGLGLVSGVPGLIGLALSAVSWLGLALLYLRATRSGELFTLALVEALGPDYGTRGAHPKERGSGQHRRPGVLATRRKRAHYARDVDLAYGDAGKQNRLDIWRDPDTGPGDRRPVLLNVPGGAWVMGSKKGQAYPLFSHLVERGWVCVSISHRLAPKNLWPAHIVDTKRAVAWVKDHIVEYGGDPDFVVISGGSSGGHIASLVGLTWDDPAFQPGFEDADTSVRAVVPFYGVYDWSDEAKTGGRIFLPHIQRTVMKRRWADDPAPFIASSPLRRLRPDAPPFFISFGVNDTMVTPRQPRAFIPRLREVSAAPVVSVELPDAQHSYDLFSSPRSAAAAQAVGAFLGVVYADYRSSLEPGRT